MPQYVAEPHAQIAEIRRAIAATAEDPPSAGIKLMMSAEDIAAIMPGRTADTVRDKHRGWTKQNGFPAPIPGMMPLVWSGPQVMAWLRGDQPAVIEVKAEPVSVLAQRYGGGR